MEKSKGLSRLKAIYFLLVGILVIAVVAGTSIILKKMGASDARNTVMILAVIVIVLTLGISAVMLKFMQDEEKQSAVKSDKYKKLFLNLPVGFAQAQILRDPQSGRNMGYRISDANETFGRLFDLDISDYYDKVISESRVEVLQDINAWFEAYNNSGTKQGELLAVEITMERLNKVFNIVFRKEFFKL